MPSYFFKISSTDLSGYEDIQNHSVQLLDEYETWVDGNHVTHRVITRTRISGTVILGFKKATDFAALQTLLGSAKDANGYYPISVYCNNTGACESVNAFLDIQGADKWDVTNSRQWQVVTITISQR